MRTFWIAGVVIAIALTVSVAACGGKKDAEEAQKAAEQAQKAAGQAEKSEDSAPASMQDMAKGMQQFAEAMQQMQQSPDGKNYEPVNFEVLQELLPDVSGWEKGESRGETMTSPVKFSQAEVAYTKGDARIEVKVVDTAMSQLLTMPYQMFLMANYSKQSSTGYEKATKIGGFPAWEKWDKNNREAEVGVLVGQRFLVTAEGSGLENAGEAQAVIAKLDLGKLASLK